MLELAYPLALVALPAPLLIYWLVPPHRERVSALRVPFFRDMVVATGLEARAGAVVLSRRFLQIAGAILLWMLLVFGLAKPQWVASRSCAPKRRAT